MGLSIVPAATSAPGNTYVTTQAYKGSQLYFIGPSTGKVCTLAGNVLSIFANPSGPAIHFLCENGGNLYGSSFGDEQELWRWNGSAWVQQGGSFSTGCGMVSFGGTLYLLGSFFYEGVMRLSGTNVIGYAPLPFYALYFKLIVFQGALYAVRSSGEIYLITAGVSTLVVPAVGSIANVGFGNNPFVVGDLLYFGNEYEGVDPDADGSLFSWDGVAATWTVVVPYNSAVPVRDIFTFDDRLFVQPAASPFVIYEVIGDEFISTELPSTGISLVDGSRTILGGPAPLSEMASTPDPVDDGFFPMGGL